MARCTRAVANRGVPCAGAHLAVLLLTATLVLVLEGCGGGGSGKATTTGKPTTTTSTTTEYVAPGQCSELERKSACAAGFCNSGNDGCTCMPNWDRLGNICAPPAKNKNMTFYMYRAQDDHDFNWANDDMASLSGVMFYLHNEVVIQSCPRHYDITRVVRIKVQIFNTPETFGLRGWKNLFGPFAIFDHLGCHDCQERIFDHYGYVVGCQTPGASDNYTWAGYKPIWYSLPGACPSQDLDKKTAKCKKEQPGGQCDSPDGTSTCTWNYTDAGSVRIEELYGPHFDMKKYCIELGGHNIPGEYDRNTDKGKYGVSFWDDRNDMAANSRRVEALRALFKQKYPGMPDLPEPWCDYAEPPPNSLASVVM